MVTFSKAPAPWPARSFRATTAAHAARTSSADAGVTPSDFSTQESAIASSTEKSAQPIAVVTMGAGAPEASLCPSR